MITRGQILPVATSQRRQVSSAGSIASRLGGFTLVEMLVVVALTVLLMSIIAEIFVLASETLTNLRAVSDANQKIRTVEAIVRQDLANRTIREVQPTAERMMFGPGPDGIFGTADDDYFVMPVGVDPGKNLGYFMIVEHSPSDDQGEDTDDELAFTVRATASSQPGLINTASGYFGRAIPNSEPDQGYLPANDGLASSQEAEVVYFLRRGTLYRRVLLVGVPQPSDTAVFNPSRFATPQSWYSKYDVSARPPINFPEVPIVNTLGDLSYRSTRFGHRPPTAYTTGLTTTIPEIQPGLATDHPADPLFLTNGYGPGPLPTTATFPGGPTQATGASLEFDDMNRDMLHNAQTSTQPLDYNHNYPGSPLSLNEFWTARPTYRETSAFVQASGAYFNYPNDPLSNIWAEFTNPASPRYVNTLDANATLAAEDAILTNVISFDIKVWDSDAIPNPTRRPRAGILPPLSSADATGSFVDLGKSSNAFAADPSYLVTGPYPSSGTPAGPPSVTFSAATAPTCYPFAGAGSPSTTPRPGIWPPQRPLLLLVGPPPAWTEQAPFAEPLLPATLSGNYHVPPGMAGYRRGFGMPYGAMLPDGTQNNTPWAVTPLAMAGPPPTYLPPAGFPPAAPGLPLGLLRAPTALARTYDTWCSVYTKPTQLWQDTTGDGIPTIGEPGIPVAPPYIVPLRGIQIKIRFVDPDTRLTRELTIIQELQ
jgi:hypothetical protein